MDYITLLIKGTMADAAREMAARSLVTMTIDINTARGVFAKGHDEIIVRTPFTTHTHDKVAQWLCLPPHRAPYPAGALLHYRLPEPLEV